MIFDILVIQNLISGLSQEPMFFLRRHDSCNACNRRCGSAHTESLGLRDPSYQIIDIGPAPYNAQEPWAGSHLELPVDLSVGKVAHQGWPITEKQYPLVLVLSET